MKINFFARLRQFLRTTLIGGVVALLPLALVGLLFWWLIQLVEKYLGPLVRYITSSSFWNEFSGTMWYELLVYFLTIMAILLIFFFLGLVIKTRIGLFVRDKMEKNYLMKVPGYKIAKETVQQFFGKNKSFFKEVVLVDIFKCGTLMTGFITDRHDKYVTIFIPTGPNPTSGMIYHVHEDQVIPTDTSVGDGMKSIISCGAGSSNLFEQQINQFAVKKLEQKK